MAIQKQDPLDRIFHALGDRTRRQMLAMLAKRGECTATDLGRPFKIAQPSVSKHIGVLEKAGLLSRRVDGRVHRFRLVEKRLRLAEGWIGHQRKFWTASLDALGELLDEVSGEDKN